MTEAVRNAGSGSLFLRWARDSVRSRGLLKSLGYLGKQVWEVLCDSTPERRRARFGDIDYDCDYGVDTTWARLSWRIRLREIFTERLYQPTVPEEFGEIMQRLPRLDFTQYTFVDLGSGKGRALLMAADYLFRRIIGVEIQPELHAIAEENLQKLRERAPHINAQALCLDAREFLFPPEPLIVYLFNPFPDYVLATVIENLGQSAVCHPRPVYLIYNAPFEEHVLERAGFLRKISQTHQYAIYSVE
ncbi:MAG: class I SAM-dependent methyltransferase [Candidatus Korobacteraceae bacterium]|jgi:SAM-dependent methyltransferase